MRVILFITTENALKLDHETEEGSVIWSLVHVLTGIIMHGLFIAAVMPSCT